MSAEPVRVSVPTGAAPARLDPRERWIEDLLACVHCGFCLPACPTYRVLSDENDSPRGRIALMRALADDRLGPGGAYAEHIDRCLGCRACETACPAGVRYGSLLERARERAAAGPLGRLLDGALLSAVTRRPLAIVVYALGRAVRDLGPLRFLARRLPGRAGLALALLVATRPSRVRGGSHAPPGADGGRGGGARPISPRTGKHRYALLEGCVMRGLFPHVHAATRRTLRRRGFDESLAPGQACCGALHAHAGRMDAARAMARRNIEAFERASVDVVVVNSAGCGAALKEYPEWLRGDGGWEARARALAGRVRDVTELLAPRQEGGPETQPDDRAPRNGPAPKKGPAPRNGSAPAEGPAPARLAGRVAYDAPCHLLHAQGIRTPPLAALGAIEGLDVEPLPSMDRCCGGAGVYNLRRPELSARVLAPKLAEIREGGYDWVATGNPGCLMFVGAGLLRAGDPTPAVHPVEIVDRAESG